MVNAATAQTEVTVDSGKVYQNNRPYTGWYSTGGQKYYSVNGKRAKGWRKIGGKYYYFAGNYRLAVNKIVGSKSRGYYYVDENGMRVTTKEIRQAVSFVMKYSSPKLSRQKRLKKCFQALLKYPYHRMTDGEPSARKIASCARYMFLAKRGKLSLCFCDGLHRKSSWIRYQSCCRSSHCKRTESTIVSSWMV